VEKIEISQYGFNIEREPLIRPFHFKGSFFTEKWIIITSLETGEGTQATGLGGLAVLWSDPAVFSSYSEAGGNIIMAALAERAVQLAKGRSFSNPSELIESLIGELHEFGRTITGKRNLRKTFILNSLVSLDMALWKLVSLEHNIDTFHDLIPQEHQAAFACRQERLAHIPLITYNYPMEDLKGLVDGGYFFLKIKIGQPGSAQEMLEKDKERLSQIHGALKERETSHTPKGKLLYYLDANGRYPNKNTLQELLDHAGKVGMLDQIVLLEEPFSDEAEIDVSDLPVPVAADESLHDVGDVNGRIDLGYRSIALKPAGKTLSMSLTMASTAFRRGIPCFVADSACVPVLVEWNKNVAAHLSPFPGLSMGILESNGAQNYKHWGDLLEDHPLAGAGWVEPRGGLFHLDSDFYDTAGGIFRRPGHYEKTVGRSG
jgi:L-alanine-DL-glutamate epimerase-like enolase superfamily enzyme